jgi:hypothetical protein
MRRRFPTFLLVAALSALAPALAHAQYLDPGAGSVVVQAIIAGAIGIATVVKLYWSKIKGLFGHRSDPPES